MFGQNGLLFQLLSICYKTDLSLYSNYLILRLWKKPRNKRILYITFLFHNKKNESHTDYRRCDSFLFFFLFRFTNKNSMIENTTIIEHTIASQLLLYAVDALFLLSSCFLTTVKSSFSCGSNERCFESGLSSGFFKSGIDPISPVINASTCSSKLR